jgi:hypothetical protein
MTPRRTALPFAALLLAGSAATAAAQQQVVHFKTLQGFLPTRDVAGYTRGKPTGQTTSAMGFTISEASIEYESQAQPSDDMSPPTLRVTITDMSGNPAAGFAQMALAFDIEQETEDGYQKSIQVEGKYRGTEQATTTQGSESCSITVLVGTRFVVQLDGSGTADAKLLHGLLGTMKLSELENAKAGPAK